MIVGNMVLVLGASPPVKMHCPTIMDTTKDRMNGGRMATAQPTHVRLTAAVAPSQHEDLEAMKDNELNQQKRYRGERTHSPKGHIKRCSSTRPGSVVGTGHDAGPSLLFTSCPDQPHGHVVLCHGLHGLGQAFFNQGRVAQPASHATVSRPKSCCSSGSSCSSVEDAVDAHTRVGQSEDSPPLPPRGANCYENVPAPGIIPLSKSSAQTTVISQRQLDSTHAISLYSRMSGLDRGPGKENLSRALSRLNQSGFFFDTIDAADAKAKLRTAQVGTFLVRISSQTSHLFALSVKTNRGTTSIRLNCDHVTYNFSLDADPQSAAKMPAFNCIIALIEYYVVQSASDARNKCVFLESNGRRDTPVILTRPLRDRPQSLKHLCRRTLHYHHNADTLDNLLGNTSPPCSVQVKQYIMDYPYAL